MDEKRNKERKDHRRSTREESLKTKSHDLVNRGHDVSNESVRRARILVEALTGSSP